MKTMGPQAAVHAAVIALAAGDLTETAFVDRLVRMPTVPQLPAAPEWSDGTVSADGPVRALRREALGEAITAELYERTVRAMLEAGHEG